MTNAVHLRFVLFRDRASTQAPAAFATERQAFLHAKYHRLHIYDLEKLTWCRAEDLALEWSMAKTNREHIEREGDRPH